MEADNGSFVVLCELSDREELYNSFLYGRKPEVVTFQNVSCNVRIEVLNVSDTPG